VSVVLSFSRAVFLSQRGLERKSGVKQALIAQVEKKRRGLTQGAALKLAEALDVDPVALFLDSQSAAIKARADAGEITHRQALGAIARVAVTMKDMMGAGEVAGSPELVNAANKTRDVIEGREGSHTAGARRAREPGGQAEDPRRDPGQEYKADTTR
jgi:plasmid maintenance system antidote protein VapI